MFLISNQLISNTYRGSFGDPFDKDLQFQLEPMDPNDIAVSLNPPTFDVFIYYYSINTDYS